MPAPRVEVTVRDTVTELDRLVTFRIKSQYLEPVHQYLIAELIVLRLFSIVESAIEDIACKLVAGAPYANGNRPTRLINARSREGAITAMLKCGRKKSKSILRWSSVGDIRDSTLHVFKPTEPFITYAQAHGNILSEMRRVRNYLAHRKAPKAKKGYKEVVRVVYGANSRIGIEAFLTSRRSRPVAKIDEYLVTAKTLVSDLAGG